MTILNQPDTVFVSRAEAEHCADCCGRDDSDWTYSVERIHLDPPRWKVAVRDEDNELIAYM